MQVNFYTKYKNALWKDMKGKICLSILRNLCADSTPKYYIHFDKMLFKIGWFVGFVEVWKGKTPREKNRRRIEFIVHVIDWEGQDDCRKRVDYRVTNKG